MSDNSNAKARQYLGSLGSNHPAPGRHTKYDPTNHGVQIAAPEYENPNRELTGVEDIGQSGPAKLGHAFGQLVTPRTQPGVDPLTGDGHAHFEDAPQSELKGVVAGLNSLTSLLGQMLVEISAQRPSMPLTIDGALALRANDKNDYTFLLDQKRVPALNVHIYNNTGSTIYLAISEPATPNDIPIVAGGSYSLNDAKTDYISIYSTIAANVSRVKNQQKQANAVIIYAWGNPEWRHFWGEI